MDNISTYNFTHINKKPSTKFIDEFVLIIKIYNFTYVYIDST